MEFVKIIAAIFLPPLAVGLHLGVNDAHFWFNLCLTIFGCWLPGVLHAFYVLTKEIPNGSED